MDGRHDLVEEKDVEFHWTGNCGSGFSRGSIGGSGSTAFVFALKNIAAQKESTLEAVMSVHLSAWN